jgi:Phage X family
VHIDWISVSQYHGESAPEFVGSLAFKGLSVRGLDHTDPVDILESAGPRKLEGSFSSSLQVKSHGGWVKVSGNPARFDRPDNLFGFDLDESMHRINAAIACVGLPPFQPGQELRPEQDEDGVVKPARWTGAAFSRIDLCENYETGSELLARLAIRAYQQRAAAYLKKATYGEETALWHNTRRSVKVYRKGPDMAVHCPASPWIEWANERGVIRHEVAIKSRFLSGTGLRYWGNLTMSTLHRLFTEETAILQSPDATLDPLAVEAVPASARLAYAAWLKGEDVRALLPRRTWYRHRKTLLNAASIDIAEVRHTATITPIVRTIELRPAVEPAGYWQAAA